MDDKDIAIMLQLIANPRTSNKAIAQNTNISEATVSRRIKSLNKRGVLMGTQIQFDRGKLGLELVSIILIPKEPWSKSMILLQLFFDLHAYTAYQNRVFGQNNGLFVQLNIPKTSIAHLDELFTEFQKYGLLDDYFVFKQVYSSLIYPVYPQRYDMTSRKFKFDYDEIREKLGEPHLTITLTKEDLEPDLLEMENFAILNQLHKGADRSLAEIGKQIGMSKQEVSKRKIKLNLDDWHYDVRYDRKQFGVFNQALYVLNYDEKLLSSLDAVLREEYPFRALIIPCEKAILLQMDLPSVDVMQVTDILLEQFDQVDLYLLGRMPYTYAPWSGNLENGEWISTTERIIKTFQPDYKHQVTVEEFVSNYQNKNLEYLRQQLEKTHK